MKNFEQNLSRLEELTTSIKRTDISLEDALKAFEEGIKLAKSMEKDIDRIEGRIQILMNDPMASEGTAPELDLFSSAGETTGTAGAPEEGLRQNG